LVFVVCGCCEWFVEFCYWWFVMCCVGCLCVCVLWLGSLVGGSLGVLMGCMGWCLGGLVVFGWVC
jgi:putative Mn2+ efflux pump MntP